jgi:hypothetical protein
MSKRKLTFIGACLVGEALPEEIDDYVEAWHASKVRQPLNDFLGMTKEEYQFWLNDSGSIALIVGARKLKVPLSEAIENAMSLPIAARGKNRPELERVVAWLQRKKGL